jgi:hypothetical protein
MLTRLLENIELEKKYFKLKIFVFNDGSNEIYDLSNFDVTHIKMYPNGGKQKYWNLINNTFKIIKNINSKYFIYLPDDIKVVNNFFDEVKYEYEKIKDYNKICLSILTDNRVTRTNWTNFNPIHFNSVIKTQWNDLCFISEKKFFEVLDYKINPIPINRWEKNHNLSSGVGEQISTLLHNKNYSQYHTKKSMVYHGDHESVMNYDERKKNKLITN